MLADSAVTYTFVHSEAHLRVFHLRILTRAARQVLEQAPRSPEYVPDPNRVGQDHEPVYIPKPEHPEI
ncbi:hypothetical protein Tco_1456829 [Tanacetum coccineum]